MDWQILTGNRVAEALTTTAALMALTAMAHVADEDTGIARATYMIKSATRPV